MHRRPSDALSAWSGALIVATMLACTPDLAVPATPGGGWPDLGDPPSGLRDGRRDGALLLAIEDPALGGRPGAWGVASGWWRYLVRTRGLRRTNVITLSDSEATTENIARALARLEFRAGDNSLLWLVFIGSGEAPTGGDGLLRTADGTLELAEIRDALGAGVHESAFVVIDACADAPSTGGSSGVPASPPTPRPRFRPLPPATTPLGDRILAQLGGGGMGPAAAYARERSEMAVYDELRRRLNLFVLTSGQGTGCEADLDGRAYPGLAYSVLGGLQGWADLGDDGWVSAKELALYAQSLLAESSRRPSCGAAVQLQASGTDMILADLAGLGPHPASLARGRRRSVAIEPAIASQSTDALARARDLLVLDIEDMVPIAPGSFTMGCDPKRDTVCEDDEQPDRIVELGGFSIDRTEVTWADYRACIDAGGCPELLFYPCWVWTGLEDGFVLGGTIPESMLADDHPVMCVSWDEAQNFCAAVGKRLPTEAEWERAARGIDGRIYPWGDAEPSCTLAGLDGCSEFSGRVGSKPAGASPDGALDMAGNVAEWVFDWWQEKSYRNLRATLNPRGPETGEVRAVRGGSFYSGATDLRTSYRYGIDPNAPTSLVGFRCAR